MIETPLNQRIAELLGYKVTSQTESNGYGVTVSHWNLWRPDGTEVIDTEHDPIWYGDTLGYSSEADAWTHAPDYQHDLNAVMEALRLRENNLQMVLRWNVYEDKAECMLLKAGGGQDAHVKTAYADDFEAAAAEALYAYLQWKRRRE